MLELKNVSKTYQKVGSPEVRALNGVTLRIEQGEFVAVVGPSGSGKSTLMNIIGLLDRPTEGSYILQNEDVGQINTDELARLRNQKFGFVFQSFHLLPRTNAQENVELPLIYSDRTNIGDLAMTALKSVGLEGRAKHFPSELSGGEQQRVAIARALVNEPDIIFADEPTGNLDSKAGLEIIKIFQELHKNGKTIILVTHDQNIAEHTNRILQMVDGKIVSDKKIDKPKTVSKKVVNNNSG